MKNVRICFPVVLMVAAFMAACGTVPSRPVSSAPTPTTQVEVPVTVAPTPTLMVPASPTPIVVHDGAGRTLTLDAPAQRIVSLAPSNTEIVFSVGGGQQLVGRDERSDYPEAAASVESIGSTYGELNIEAIVSLKPDLILAAAVTPPEQVKALEQVGLSVFVVGNPDDFPALFDNLLQVGALTGHTDVAEALVSDLRARYAAVLDAVDGADSVSLFYEIDGSDPSAPWTTGSGTFQDLMFSLAGGKNIAADINGWGQMSLEQIVVADPQVIIFGGGPFVPTTVESLKARTGWGGINAVKNDQVYDVNTDLIDLPGPRLVDGLEQVAQILHPDRFEP